MYRLASWVHSYQACLQPLESHRKQIRLSRKQPVADESFSGWWRPSSPSWRSEPAGNTPVHGCALEPGCPLLNMFTAPAVLTPVFWMRWKTGKRERSEHRWKRKSCSVPFLMLQQTRGRLFSHCIHPKGSQGKLLLSAHSMMMFVQDLTSSFRYAAGSTCNVWSGGIFC